ncbi:MAG: nickel/cobalt transporter [Paracoccus hibiscisoli]|uniref:nickel/cobalt transporter n=1 Tax=Paracoccus hibiscisoli TaxID=2023261 RepID=UPI00391AD13F
MSAALSRVVALVGLAVGLVLVALWLGGGLAGIEYWATQQQRSAQNLMAGALRALRAGEPGAVASLLGLCFAYGVAHAVGPGHGKVIIGTYGFGAQVPFARLAGLSVAASVAQAGTAVALVWGGITILDLGREALTQLSEVAMAQVSTVMIALVGLWLALRGARMLRSEAARHHHDHHHHDGCGCGHAHGPTPAQVAQTRSLRDGLLVVAGIAARPCTGALFLLILTWRMGIFGIGMLGTLAMGLGTALVTVGVAGLAVWARQGSVALFPATGPWAQLGRWLPGAMQLGAGLLIAAISAAVLL